VQAGQEVRAMVDVRAILSIALNQREIIIPTDGEWFRYIKRNWNDAYLIIRPGNTEVLWKAIARWGKEDVLESDNPELLLTMIHRHYGPETEGYTEMLMARVGKLARKYS
jgi:hypothetical protein